MNWYEALWANPTKDDDNAWSWAQAAASDVAKLVELNSSQKILDLACGQGMTTIALALHGFQIEGRDLSEQMLKLASEHKVRFQASSVSFAKQDLRDLNDRKLFDIVMLRDVAFGMFDRNKNRQILVQMRGALKPKGRVVLEAYNKEVVLQNQPIEGFLTVDSSTGRLTGSRKIDSSSVEISLEILSIAEWQVALAETGFTNLQFVPALPFRKRGLTPETSLINYIIATAIE